MNLHHFVAMCGVGLLACGGTKEPLDPSGTYDQAEHERVEAQSKPQRKGGPSVQNELGEIDQGEAEKAFANAQAGILSCHQRGLAKIEYLAGDVAFLVRIGADGKARYVVLESSTLGDRPTERCMVDALMTARWPTPEGGEAEARKSLSFTPGDAREPTPWGQDKVASVVSEHGSSVNACKKDSNATYHVTLYVQPSGKAGKIQSVGVSSSSPAAFEGADCVVDALRSAKVPSPGSYATKVSFDL